jgi:hypothetical protein
VVLAVLVRPVLVAEIVQIVVEIVRIVVVSMVLVLVAELEPQLAQVHLQVVLLVGVVVELPPVVAVTRLVLSVNQEVVHPRVASQSAQSVKSSTTWWRQLLVASLCQWVRVKRCGCHVDVR